MLQLIKGFKDILPEEARVWRHIEQMTADTFADFGFAEIRPPVMEKATLFEKSIGEDTDIVEKEMYTFADRTGQLITLRPEATASVVRAYIQHKLYAGDPVQKLYTIGPMFRRERPQKGRYRQFHQINAEALGISAPYIDAQLILMLMTLLKDRLSVSDAGLHLNSLGCRQCRPDFKTALIGFLKSKQPDLCADCARRMDRNPLRVLDCKVEGCRQATAEAPAMTDFLCSDCREHFDTVTGLLNDMGLAYELDKRMVRGLDYYTRTTFEVQTGKLGAQSAIAGGGRYDELVKMLDGPDQPAVGFAIGFERLAEIVANEDVVPEARGVDLFIAALGDQSREKAFGWMCDLNRSGFRAEMAFEDRSLKSQMKLADRLHAARTLIVGDAELESGIAPLRDMTTKDQQEIAIDNLTEAIKPLLTNTDKQQRNR
ncbi:MAG: histidine--tRNA ligase [Thermodesulfobacteriota bacterium]|nr:histidine--tRNA ligase [Thermodesulfobacteriota bacterium]